MRVACLSLLLAACLGGCGIKSEQPLGDAPAVFDPAKVNGIWMGPEVLLGVRVLDAQKGLLLTWDVARFGKNGTRAFRCQPPPASERVCQPKDVLGTCAWRQLADSKEKSRYYFPEIKSKDETYTTPLVLLSDGERVAIAYFLSDDSLKDRLDEGTLPGHVDQSGSIVLGELGRDHYRLILSEKGGVVGWKRPFPLLKLPPDLDPCRKGEQGAEDSPDGERSR